MNSLQFYDGEPEILEAKALIWPCPQKCGGNMVSNGEALMTNPKGYFHECDSCGFTTVLRGERYPKLLTIRCPVNETGDLP